MVPLRMRWFGRNDDSPRPAPLAQVLASRNGVVHGTGRFGLVHALVDVDPVSRGNGMLRVLRCGAAAGKFRSAALRRVLTVSRLGSAVDSRGGRLSVDARREGRGRAIHDSIAVGVVRLGADSRRVHQSWVALMSP